MEETTSAFKVSGSPYVCMTNARCAGSTNKRVANAAGLYSSIFHKLLSLQVRTISQWSHLRDFMTLPVFTSAQSAHKFSLLLWSSRAEIDKSLVHQFIGVAHSFNVTLGTIRNAMTTNNPFIHLFQLEKKTNSSSNSTDSKSQRDLFPLLLVQCHTDDRLFTAHHAYTGSLSSPDSMATVSSFLHDFVSVEDKCTRVVEEARLQREAAARRAQATLKSFTRNDQVQEKELRQKSVAQLRDLGRDLFAGDLDVVSTDGSGSSRATLLGLGAVGESGARLSIDKADLIFSLREAEKASSSSAGQACQA